MAAVARKKKKATREAKSVRTPEPNVRTPEDGWDHSSRTGGDEGDVTRESHPHLYWPTDLSAEEKAGLASIYGEVDEAGRPQKWRRRRPTTPCQRCDRIKTSHGGHAVKVYGVDRGFAYLECRVCGHRWTLEEIGS